MKSKRLDKLRSYILEILINHLNINKLPLEKSIIKNMIKKIDNENLLKNLTLIVHFNNAKEKIDFEQFLYLFLLIIKETTEYKYTHYKMEELIEEFFGDYEDSWLILDPLLNNKDFEDFKKFIFIMKI
ncbi:MAG: hypothetical protein PHY66_08215 [Aliarcobacter sp.]|nr:hypothetical protein [Aliarcobacter sp.]MDD2887774.1 hypothetical protein [Aliarcobacter sp.]